MDDRKIMKVVTVIVMVTTLIVAVWIMAGGHGLQEELDFGAGAYYYADIPDFERYTEATKVQAGLPYIFYLLLFILWGLLMYWFWVWLDRRH